MTGHRDKPRPWGSSTLTRLAAIQADVPGPTGALIQAARRWQELAGDELIRRLPLLEIHGGVWIIGLPSARWETELARLRRSLLAAGKSVPPLRGRLLAADAPLPQPTGRKTRPSPPAGADAGQRLRWIMEQMCPEDDA